MSTTLTLLISVLRLPYIVGNTYTCAPLTEIQINGRICVCDSTGVWSEANCYLAERRGLCQPGQIVTQGCSQCICQEDGKLSCAEQTCSNPVDMNHQTLTTAIHWCTPFRAYYVSCNICLCPASGLTIEANCAFDTSCTLTGQPSKKEIAAKKSICIQNVMYLFNCLHCLCGEDGFFSLENCIETCANPLKFEDTRRCVPKTYYRHDCNVCKCPDNGIPDDKHCTKAACGQDTNLQLFLTLRNMSLDCTPNTFTNAHCLYCECDSKGKMDEKLCLGLECLDFDEFKYDVAKDTCTYGEMVPVCIECFCLRHGQTTEEYCTKGCSYQNKVNVLERVLKDSVNNAMLIGHDSIKEISSDDKCEPNTIYKDEGKFCICPGNAVTNFNLCTVTEENDLNRISKVPENINIDFNISCEPSTFVDFDCNTCFCSKKGKIDPKWCTYDDCKAKKITQMKHENAKPSISTANAKPSISTAIERSNKCTPGTISIEDCNFCICPDNAVFIDKVCTKNVCSSFTTLPDNNNFICEPLAYYEVDCNVCFCPRDGLKNVAKCTKNHCEKSYLRSEVCVPGQLFTDECNVCVCPPNGNKADKACTNYTCPEEAQWKKIYQLSETLLGNQVSEDATRKLDLCFPGEEFIVGCKVCVCPDMGLRAYATCSSVLCNGHDVKENSQDNHERVIRSVSLARILEVTENVATNTSNSNITQGTTKQIKKSNANVTSFTKSLRREEDCVNFTTSEKPDRLRCSPGSMYIIRCQECICPYAGNINRFCRPLPKDFYCEEAFPGSSYLPMGRKSSNTDKIAEQVNETSVNTSRVIKHLHTMHPCGHVGKMLDSCFICECAENHFLIEEHCFKSDSEKCANATPSFW